MSAIEKLRQTLKERGVKYKEYGGVTKGTMEPYSRYVMYGDDGYVRAIIEADSRDEVLLTLRCSAEHAVDAILDAGRLADVGH